MVVQLVGRTSERQGLIGQNVLPSKRPSAGFWDIAGWGLARRTIRAYMSASVRKGLHQLISISIGCVGTSKVWWCFSVCISKHDFCVYTCYNDKSAEARHRHAGH